MTSPQHQLKRRLTIVSALLIPLILAILWYQSNQAPINDKDWDLNRQNLPDIAVLEQRIELDLFGAESPSTKGMAPDTDQPMDIQAMEAKLAGLTKNVTTLRQPTEQELQQFYQQNQSDYREASKFSFRHILFSRAKHGGQVYLKAQQALAELELGNNPAGDTSDLSQDYSNVGSDKVDVIFGRGFATKLLTQLLASPQKLPCWTDPISSNYGVHLVCFDNVRLGEFPNLDEVRSQIINDWRYSISTAE